MGGAASSPSLWTEEEEEENKQSILFQKKCTDFATKYLFFNVSIRGGKKSADPLSPYWIEPNQEAILNSMGNQATTEFDKFVRSIPSGVLVDRCGTMKIYFSTDLVYEINFADVEASLFEFDKNNGSIVAPNPPNCLRATRNTMRLQWDLPKPPGIIHQVEVQYARLSDDSESVVDAIWQALVTKTYEFSEFYFHDFENLSPGSAYRFRMKYRNFLGYSERSEPSPVFKCLPDKPEAPITLRTSLVTQSAIELTWQPPLRDNGSHVTHYTLQGRAAGDEMQELFRGNCLSYLVINVEADSMYSFQVAAINNEGQSEFSTMLTVKTLRASGLRKMREAISRAQRGAGLNQQQGSRQQQAFMGIEALMEEQLSPEDLAAMTLQMNIALGCKLAWRTCWDPHGQQAFYFNTLTGTRQLEVPTALTAPTPAPPVRDVTGSSGAAAQRRAAQQSALGVMGACTVVDDSEESNAQKKETAFRMKRYKLVRALHKHAAAHITALNSGGPSKHKLSHSSAHPFACHKQVAVKISDTDNKCSDQEEDEDRVQVVVNLEYDQALSAPNHRTSEGGQTTPPRNDIKELLLVSLRRQSMLADIFDIFMRQCSLHDLTNRMKVSFVGEDGIDSGGLGKEAFMLLSKQAGHFAGPHHKNWMKLIGKKLDSLFFNDEHVVGHHDTKSKSAQSHDKHVTTHSPLTRAISATKKNSSNSAVQQSQLQENNINNNNKNKQAVAPEASVAGKASAESVALLDDMQASGSEFAEFLGKLLAKALYDRQLIDLPLSHTLFQHLLGRVTLPTVETNKHENIGKKISSSSAASSVLPSSTVTPTKSAPGKATITPGPTPELPAHLLKNKDTEQLEAMMTELSELDEALHHSLLWMLQNDITNIIDETFSVEVAGKSISLCAHGDTMAVTEANKVEYVKLMCSWKTTFSVSALLTSFLSGFHALVPLHILREPDVNLSAEELYLILNGKQLVDVDELRAYCVFQGAGSQGGNFNEDHQLVVWLFEAMRKMTDNDRRSLLKFFTGSSRVPLDGFDPPLNITQGLDMAADSLPRAHTCFNQLVLPPYSSFAKMYTKILFAVKNTEGFGFA